MHVFADHDRIVDEQAEHHDEGEEGNHVDRNVGDWKDQESTEDREWNAQAHPDRKLQTQEEGERDEDENESAETILDQDSETIAEHVCGILPGRDGKTFGEQAAKDFDLVRDRVLQLQDLLIPNSENPDTHGRVPIEVRVAILFVEAIDDSSDIGEEQPGSIGFRTQNDLLEFRTRVGLSLGAKKNFTGARLDRTAGAIEGSAADGRHDFVEGQRESLQRFFRDFDRNLVVPCILQFDLGDIGQAGDRITNSFAIDLERLFRGVGADRDSKDGAFDFSVTDDRLFGFDRECRDRVDRILDFGERAVDRIAVHEFGAYTACALGRGRGDLLDAVQAVDLFFDSDTDTLLDFLGRGAEIDHADGNDVDVDIGEGLLLNARIAEDSAKDHQRHQKIGRDMVPSEPCDDAIHWRISAGSPGRLARPWFSSDWSTGSFAPFGSKTRTRIPLMAACKGVVQMRSPDSSPALTMMFSRSIRRTSTFRNWIRCSESTT